MPLTDDEMLLAQSKLGQLILRMRQQREDATFSQSVQQDAGQADDERTVQLLGLTALGRQALQARPQGQVSFASTPRSPEAEFTELVEAELRRVRARDGDLSARGRAVLTVLRTHPNLKKRLAEAAKRQSSPAGGGAS